MREETNQTNEKMQPVQALGIEQAYRQMTPDERVNDLFTYHSPRPDQVPHYEAIREAAKYFAKIILANTPGSADQSDAIRKLRECVMTANASIALDGRG